MLGQHEVSCNTPTQRPKNPGRFQLVRGCASRPKSGDVFDFPPHRSAVRVCRCVASRVPSCPGLKDRGIQAEFLY